MPKSPTGLSSLNPTPTPKIQNSSIFSARVRFAMVDDQTQNQAFKDFGEWSSIGCIFFDKINQPNPNPQFSSDNFARLIK